MKVNVSHVSLRIAEKSILQDLSLHVPSGAFVGLLGPNGSGKSSLLRCIYRVLQPDAGLITLNDTDVWQIRVRDMAQKTATVLQERSADFDVTVEELVMMGRTPHKRMFERDTAEDSALIQDALMRVNMVSALNRTFQTLSGGEKQRVLIARALVQQAQFIVLDEPTNHLDICHQLQILRLIRSLRVTTLAALHDLNLAATYCDYLYLLDHGTVVASGTPDKVLQPDLIRTVFGVDAYVTRSDRTGSLQVQFFLEEGEPIHAINKH